MPFSLPLAMLVVFGSAKILSDIFERIGMPGIAGEILAGILIGPSVLHWVAPNETLRSLSDLGVLFLLFSIGLEVRLADLLRVGLLSTVVATLGEAFPFVAAWGLLLAWGGSGHAALFMGAALVATSVGISASVLKEKDLLQHRASKIILAAAVIDDVLGLIVLAVVSSVARGRFNVTEILVTAALATLFVVVTALWGTRVVSRIFPRFHSRIRADEAQFDVAMVLLFGLAVLAFYAGVAAIVGAFLAGLALAESADSRVRNLTRGVTELLVPFFLAGIGLSFDLSIFRSRSTILMALAILAAAIVAKVAGCSLATISEGWRNSLRVGVGMIPRGEVAMVAAQLGLSTLILNAATYSVIVFVVVASALLTPPLLTLAFGRALPAKP
ncbi:MAG TPA: cation:proton antiporter [Candidatus Acidoferrales bacterium]|nr:cation:proton antiporter [Candidatus Acidoferrales bacterium]